MNARQTRALFGGNRSFRPARRLPLLAVVSLSLLSLLSLPDAVLAAHPRLTLSTSASLQLAGPFQTPVLIVPVKASCPPQVYAGMPGARVEVTQVIDEETVASGFGIVQLTCDDTAHSYQARIFSRSVSFQEGTALARASFTSCTGIPPRFSCQRVEARPQSIEITVAGSH